MRISLLLKLSGYNAYIISTVVDFAAIPAALHEAIMPI